MSERQKFSLERVLDVVNALRRKLSFRRKNQLVVSMRARVPVEFNVPSEPVFESGITIEGLTTFEQLNEFARNLALRIVAGRLVGDQTRYYINDSPNPRDLLEAPFKDQASKEGFYGMIKNFNITILSPDLSFRDKLRSQAPINPSEVSTFRVIGEMHSTGRGIIGYIQRECTLYVHPDYNYSAHNHHLVRFNSRPINKEQTRNDIEALKKESKRLSYAAWLNSASSVASGGLPGLGKKR